MYNVCMFFILFFIFPSAGYRHFFWPEYNFSAVRVSYILLLLTAEYVCSVYICVSTLKKKFWPDDAIKWPQKKITFWLNYNADSL